MENYSIKILLPSRFAKWKRPIYKLFKTRQLIVKHPNSQFFDEKVLLKVLKFILHSLLSYPTGN